MSRLDDELKIAFQRQEPSADFAARVLARINEAPAPQPRITLWQRLRGGIAMPRLGYAAAGAMALLLIIIGLSLLRSHRTAGVEDSRLQAAAAVSYGDPASHNQGSGGVAPEGRAPGHAESGMPDGGSRSSTNSATARNHSEPAFHTGAGRRQSYHYAPAVAKQSPPSAEAEAAKEKVLFALQITSETLNDAQRAISADRPRDEKPEPVQNR